MKEIFLSIICFFIIIQTSAESTCAHQNTPNDSRCSGCPPMKDGKLCASTTKYTDLTKGSCGCGTDPNPKAFWTKTKYTAALNAANLNPSDPTLSWCPSHCGQCFRLCNTGGTTNGRSSGEGQCIIVQIENRCGDGYKQYPYFCSQEMTYWDCASDSANCKSYDRATNYYGYPAHFDLQDVNEQVTQMGWDNPEVTFEEVSCSLGDFGSWDNCCCPEYAESFLE